MNNIAAYVKSTVGSKMSLAGLMYLTQLVPMAPKGLLVDLGTYRGASAIALVLAQIGREVVTIDNYREGADAKTGAGAPPDLLDVAVALEPYHITQLFGDTAEMAAYIGGEIAMVFVDADHTAEGVRRDIEAWKPLVIPGGIMAFDDYGSERWPDVQPTVDSQMRGWKRLGVRGSVAAFRRGE